MYSTKSLKNEYRTIALDGARFDVCEHCGYDSSVSGTPYNVSYYHNFGITLCDRCVDKSHYPNDNYWEDSDAKDAGFPVPFPQPTPKKIDKNVKEVEKAWGKKYENS